MHHPSCSVAEGTVPREHLSSESEPGAIDIEASVAEALGMVSRDFWVPSNLIYGQSYILTAEAPLLEELMGKVGLREWQ